MQHCRSVMLLALCFFLFVTLSSGTTDCPSGVEFTNQPPPILGCNPAVGDSITLFCGINGITDLPNILKWNFAGSSNNFNVSNSTIESVGVVDFGVSSRLTITVSEAKYGLYWCTVDGYSTPSTVTPICPSLFNASLPNCTKPSYSTDQSMCVNNETSPSIPTVTDDIRQQCLSLVTASSTTIDMIPSTTRQPSSFNATSDVILSSSIITLRPTSNAAIPPHITVTSTIPAAGTITTISGSTVTNTTRNGGLPPSNPTTESPSRNQTTASTSGILIGLIVVCILLGCVAMAIVGAITVLCFLTRRGKLAASAGHNHGTKPPTVDPISKYEEGSPVQDATSQSTNESPPLQTPDEQTVSFSNPVYEISITVPSAQPQLNPPKNLPPTDYSSSPPIFSDDIGPNKHRSYYTKPDLSKKRSHSITAQDKPTTVSPAPPPTHSPTPEVPPQVPSITNEVMYDTPMEMEPDNGGVYSYAKPSIPIPAPSTLAAPVKCEPGYEDPWEKLPIAVKRSRESTRSRSYQPNTSAPPINNNNNNKPLFDDPTYDIPSV